MLAAAPAGDRLRSPHALTAFESARRPRTDWVRAQTHRRDRTRALPPVVRNSVLRPAGRRIFRANYRPLLAEPLQRQQQLSAQRAPVRGEEVEPLLERLDVPVEAERPPHEPHGRRARGEVRHPLGEPAHVVLLAGVEPELQREPRRPLGLRVRVRQPEVARVELRPGPSGPCRPPCRGARRAPAAPPSRAAAGRAPGRDPAARASAPRTRAPAPRRPRRRAWRPAAGP